ncbi:MAG TPA: hypothetical protein VH619_05870 [Verrucomicrobiae bacterium]|jgi:hypothetical protein|nr:hypothetical protein [Verrucomicrobiae bacterium]
MQESNDRHWDKVPTPHLVGFFVAIGVFAVVMLNSEAGFIPLLDHANLVFHEAGHPIVGLFSQRLETYGGTMGQLAFPILLAMLFWRSRESISFAVSVIWFFENWLNIARYMADARVQVLPLVGGGDHDWARIFGRWNVLNHDVQIAAAVRTIGWLGMGAACTWVAWLWWAGRKHSATLGEMGLANQAITDTKARL